MKIKEKKMYIGKKCLICGKTQEYYFKKNTFQYYRCTVCNFTSTYPYPTEKVIKEHYKNKFTKGNYSLLHGFSKQYRHVYEGIISVLEKQINKKLNYKNLIVLDIGCFTGDFLLMLKNRGAKVRGLELQKEAVKIANKKLKGKVFEANVMTDTFPKLNYNLITLLGVIEHVNNPHSLFKKCAELLQENGILLIQTPNSESLLAKTLKKYWPPYQPIEHIHLFSAESLKIELKKIGFTNITVTPHWKTLPIEYVYDMFQNFGPHFYKIFGPLYKLLPPSVKKFSLPFYAGEMIVTAQKNGSPK